MGGVAGAVGAAQVGALGTLTLSADGSFIYVVNESGAVRALPGGASATESFTYTLAAGGVSGGSQLLVMTVVGVNDAPTAISDINYSVREDIGNTSSGNLLNNDFDPDTGASLTVVGVAGGSVGSAVAGTYGSVQINADGSFTYTLNNANPATQALTVAQGGTETFTYTISDGTTTSSSTLAVTVFGTGEATIPTGLHLHSADDIGRSATDNVTSVTSGLTIAGRAEAGVTVELYDGAALLGTTLANESGVFTTDVALASGVHALTARAVDVAGNRSGSSASLALTIDTSTTVSTPDLIAESDTGPLATDNYTRGPTTVPIDVVGTAEPLSTVRIYIRTIPGPDATSFDTPNGRVSVIGPLAEVTAGADGSYAARLSTSSPGFPGHVAGGLLGSENTYLIVARATDIAGNDLFSDGMSLTLDTRPPTIANFRLAPADDTGVVGDRTTSKGSVSLLGTTDAGAEVTIGGTTVLAGADGSFSIPVALAVGNNSFTPSIRDLAGNLSTGVPAAQTIVITRTAISGEDRIPRGLDLLAEDDTGTSTTDNVTRQTSGLTIEGMAEPNATVELYDNGVLRGTTTSTVSGLFRTDLSLTAGTHSITARSIDASNSASEQSTALSIVVDASLSVSTPDLAATSDTGASSTDDRTRDTTPRIVGITDPLATVTLRFRHLQDNGQFADYPTISLTADAAGNYTFDNTAVPGFTSGNLGRMQTHQVFVDATDAAGNTASGGSLTFVLDTLPPVASNLQLAAADDTGTVGDRTTNKSMVTITGTTETGSTVTVGARSVAASNTGDFAILVDLQPGENAIAPSIVDVAGVASRNTVPERIIITREAIGGMMFEQIAITDSDSPFSPSGIFDQDNNLVMIQGFEFGSQLPDIP